MKTPILLQAFSGHALCGKRRRSCQPRCFRDGAAFDKRIRELTGFRLKGLTPISLAKNVTVSPLFAQVRKDALIEF